MIQAAQAIGQFQGIQVQRGVLRQARAQLVEHQGGIKEDPAGRLADARWRAAVSRSGVPARPCTRAVRRVGSNVIDLPAARL